MKTPDEEVIKALCNLELNPDFRVVHQWLLDSASQAERTLRTAEALPLIHRSQGAVLELLEICNYAGNPREHAGKLATQRRQKQHNRLAI